MSHKMLRPFIVKVSVLGYTVKNNSILTYNHMSYIYVIGCCLLPMA